MAEWTERTRLADLDDYHVQADEPVATEAAIWIDTSSVMAPVMKVYVNGAWREVAGGGVVGDDVLGELGQILPAFTQAAEAEILSTLEANLAQTLPSLGQSVEGAVTGVAGSVTGSVEQTLPTLTQGVAGEMSAPPVSATLEQELPALTQAVAGEVSVPPGGNTIESLASLEGRWRAADLTLNDADSVTAMADSSGNSWDIAHVSGTAPTYVASWHNGHPGVSTTAVTGDYLQGLRPAGSMARPWSLWFITTISANSGWSAMGILDNLYRGLYVKTNLDALGGPLIYDGGARLNAGMSTPIPFHIWEAAFDSEEWRLYRDGVQVGSTASGTPGAADRITIGANSAAGGELGAFTFGEVFVLSEVVDAATRADIVDELQADYAAPQVSALSDFTDVNTASAADGQALIFDAADGLWKPGDL